MTEFLVIGVAIAILVYCGNRAGIISLSELPHASERD